MPFDGLNTFLSVGGFVVGIISFIAGVLFYFKGKSKKVLVYQIDTDYIVFALSESDLKKAPELKIFYGEQPISGLQHTTITFTNIGNQTIYSDDFAAHEKLGIKVSNLFPGMEPKFKINESNPNSAVTIDSLNSNRNLVRLKFDFLKQKQFFKVSFLHDGYVDVLGELKSGKIQEHKDFPEMPDSFFTAIITGFVVYALNVWCTLIFPIDGYQVIGILIQIVAAAVTAIYLIIGFIQWLLNRISSKFFKK